MNEDEPFLRAILANPDDRTTRLVYADWLDERADPRAEYLRLAASVAELPHDDTNRESLRLIHEPIEAVAAANRMSPVRLAAAP